MSNPDWNLEPPEDCYTCGEQPKWCTCNNSDPHELDRLDDSDIYTIKDGE
jgi:hypothetical protein